MRLEPRRSKRRVSVESKRQKLKHSRVEAAGAVGCVTPWSLHIKDRLRNSFSSSSTASHEHEVMCSDNKKRRELMLCFVFDIWIFNTLITQAVWNIKGGCALQSNKSWR